MRRYIKVKKSIKKSLKSEKVVEEMNTSITQQNQPFSNGVCVEEEGRFVIVDKKHFCNCFNL